MDVLEKNCKITYILFQEVAKLQKIPFKANANEWCPPALCSVAAQLIPFKVHGVCVRWYWVQILT